MTDTLTHVAVGRPPIESVDRALQLIAVLRTGEALTVKAVAEELGVAPSTAHRILGALVYRDFAVQGRDHRYRAGPALVDEHRLAPSPAALRTLAHPSLERLVRRMGETAHLMVLQGKHIRFVDGMESEAPLRVGVRIGDRMPAHCSAGGKAMLAELGNPELGALYADGGLPGWPTAKLDTLAALRSQLRTVRRLGYGTNFEETEQGVCGIGVAVHDVVGRVVAAITYAVPSVRFRRSELQRYVEALRDETGQIERRIGAVGAES